MGMNDSAYGINKTDPLYPIESNYLNTKEPVKVSSLYESNGCVAAATVTATTALSTFADERMELSK